MMWMMRCYGRGDWWQWNIMRRDSVDLQMQNYEQSNATVNSRSCLLRDSRTFKKFCCGFDKNSYTLLRMYVSNITSFFRVKILPSPHLLFFCNSRILHGNDDIITPTQASHDRIFLTRDRPGFILMFMSLDQLLRGQAVSFLHCRCRYHKFI